MDGHPLQYTCDDGEHQKKDTHTMGNDVVLLDHGSGGKISHAMISDMILPAFNNPILARMDDGAVFDINGTKMAFSTDSYVVDPIFSPVEISEIWPLTAR